MYRGRTVGKTATVKLASNVKIYDVSSYAETFGQKATLDPGDRIFALKNEDGEISHIFIKYKNTREAGHIGYCEHCDQEVYWHPYLKTTYDDVHHAYLTSDLSVTDVLQINKADTPVDERQELVLDLNGKTLAASTRAFWVYGKLSIIDSSKAQTGKIVGSTSGKLQAIALSDGGVVNLYSGTLTREKDVDPVAKGGGVVKVTANTTFNKYGGTIKGGMSDMGHNIYARHNSTVVTLNNVVFDNGTATDKVDLHIKNIPSVTVSGSLQMKVNMELAGEESGLLTLGELTDNTLITFTADRDGVVTVPSEKAQEYFTAGYFAAGNGKTITVNNAKELVIG